MTYKYLYQNKENRNCEGEIKARDRSDAYVQLRKMGIRPYRIIGDDPLNWKPWAIAAGYAVLISAIVVLSSMLYLKAVDGKTSGTRTFATLTPDEAVRYREKAEDAVYRAPEKFRYEVWLGVNAKLKERGLEPIERPEGLVVPEE